MKWQEGGENCIKRSFVICTLHGQVDEDETGGACGRRGMDIVGY
jgi:hypothetical protein